jgi:iron complex outermembrane receptor protein
MQARRVWSVLMTAAGGTMRAQYRGTLLLPFLLASVPFANARTLRESAACTGGHLRPAAQCQKRALLLARTTPKVPDPPPDVSRAGGPPSPRLKEVIVTAHGFAEPNFRLPAVDTTFTAKELADLGSSPNIEGVMDLVPGMAFTQSQQAGLSFISIRGISQNRNTTSPVVTRLDGVDEIDPEQFNQAMFDLSSVQVIKGPEGALYGPNAVAGAIIINTANPTNYYTGYVNLNEGDYGQYGGSFGVGGPIVKNVLQFRLAGMYSKNSGFFRNVSLPGYGENPQERWGIRLKLRLLAGHNLRFLLNSSFQRTIGTANFYHYEPALVTSTGQLAPGPFPFDFSRVNANTVSYTFYNGYPGLDDYKLDQQSFKITYTGLSFARLTSMTSYTYLTELTEAKAFPYLGGPSRVTAIGSINGVQTQYFNIHGWTEELRLTSRRSATALGLHWLAGLYYSAVNRFISSTTSQDLGKGIIPIYYVPQPNSSINPTSTFFADDNHNYTRSVYGSVGYQMPYHVGIDVADRWDEVVANQFVSPLQFGGGVPGAVNRARFIRNSPRVTLQWLPIQNVNLYATWGEGMRAGGFNQNGTGATAVLLGLRGVRDRIKEEVTKTTELGFKSHWFADRLEVNGDAYAIQDSNQPFFVFVGQVGAQILININRARMYGGDLGMRGIVFASPSLGKLTAYANGSYNHSYITRYSLNPADVGHMLPQAPLWLWNAGFQYERHVFNNHLWGPVNFFTRWDLSGRTREAWDADNSSFQGGYSTLNVRFGLRGQRLSVMASILNVTNKRYNEEFVEGGFTEPALPRTAMVTVTMKFGQ